MHLEIPSLNNYTEFFVIFYNLKKIFHYSHANKLKSFKINFYTYQLCIFKCYETLKWFTEAEEMIIV